MEAHVKRMQKRRDDNLAKIALVTALVKLISVLTELVLKLVNK